jgi:hypothetical protein
MQTSPRKVPTIRDPWPYNPFVTSIRLHGQDTISEIVNEYEAKHGFRASLFDLVIQVMIVACSYDPSDVWHTETNYVTITSELITKGSVREASEIFTFSLQNNSVTLNIALIKKIAKQQIKRLHAMQKDSFYLGESVAHIMPMQLHPEAKLTKLTYTDIKAKNGMHQAIATEKYSGQEVIFKPIGQELNNECAKAFHYLHTPRPDDVFAFGAFLPNETIPFAIVSYAKIDRKYKHAMLKAAGFNHRHTLELTRGWNHEGSPRNTMSMLYAYAHASIQQHRATHKKQPLEAIITAVNPNLGFRGSAFRAVGFKVIGEKPTAYHYLLSKSGHRHYATRRELEEHKKRTSGKLNHISSAFPLIGTKELAVVLNGPKRLPAKKTYKVSGQEYQAL